MGAERRRFGRGRPARGAVLLGCAGLLAGCASMPDSGDVTVVKASKPGDSQVRVYPVTPREKAEPGEIVDGFLEAMTGDDPGFATARKYLTKQAAASWRPEESITVLSAAPARQTTVREPEQEGASGRVYQLAGEEIATVDRRLAYQPATPQKYRGEPLHLSQVTTPEGKEWRIDSLPQGLLLGESDFQRNYRSVNKYYFAAGRGWVVADPVYIRQRQDPVTQTVQALLDGPTGWLGPAVDSNFPSGTALKEGVRTLAPDDRNTLKVPLNEKADNVGLDRCRKMAAQVLFTVGELSSTKVEEVELQRSNGSRLCVLNESQKQNYVTDRSVAFPENPYFVDTAGKLAKLEVTGDDVGRPQHVPGPFGDGSLRLGAVAVARDERHAAAVTGEGRTLRVSSIETESTPREPVVTSNGPAGRRLSAPSWDGRGDLWVADRDPAGPRIRLVPGGTGKPQDVVTPWLLDGIRIEALRLSEDGVRIALLLKEGDTTTLRIGRVERRTSGGRQTVSVVDLQSVAPRMESVTSVSWAGASRLVVLGKLAGGVQQVRYIQTDGSTSASGIPGLNEVKAVAAANDERAPLVAASSDDGIVRLQAGANWQPVGEKGTFPVYPG